MQEEKIRKIKIKEILQNISPILSIANIEKNKERLRNCYPLKEVTETQLKETYDPGLDPGAGKNIADRELQNNII